MLDDLAIVPWYLSESDYRLFRESATDSSDFFDNYDQWRRAALDHEHRAAEAGVVIFRSRVSFGDFDRWRCENNLENNHQTRFEFAKLRAAKLISDGEDLR